MSRMMRADFIESCFSWCNSNCLSLTQTPSGKTTKRTRHNHNVTRGQYTHNQPMINQIEGIAFAHYATRILLLRLPEQEAVPQSKLIHYNWIAFYRYTVISLVLLFSDILNFEVGILSLYFRVGVHFQCFLVIKALFFFFKYIYH